MKARSRRAATASIDALFSLAGRVALVTGGNGGLGRAIADALRSAGAQVVVTGRDVDKNRATTREFPCYRLDVRRRADVSRTVSRVVHRFGQLDILVNNAGVFRGGVLTELGDRWDEVIDTNLTGAFVCAHHAARTMIQRGSGGKIINVGSMYSIFGHPASACYSASKSGVIGLTRALAVELGPHGIQVNALLPGWYPTGMCPRLETSRLGAQIRERTPACRLGRASDLAGTAIFLASTASDFVTGAAIPVDGGYAVADRSALRPRSR